MVRNPYIGRFAPSPTGPLHFGSLISAVGSYLEARTQQGLWLVRIDDLDPPREQTGAAADILRTLEHFGFQWDSEVMYQSQRHAAYQAALQQLDAAQLTYPCTCSRKQLIATAKMGEYGPIYPGTCLQTPPQSDKPAATRIHTQHQHIRFTDQIQGDYAQNLTDAIGDFILHRSDGLFAYHLAVAVDDAEQHVSHIVRGFDLLDSTPRQIYLQQQLNLNTPQYAHLPIAVNKQNQKLSKQHFALALDKQQANTLLWQALEFLGQAPAIELKHADLNTLWNWARQNWSLYKVPQCQQIFFKE